MFVGLEVPPPGNGWGLGPLSGCSGKTNIAFAFIVSSSFPIENMGKVQHLTLNADLHNVS